MVQTDPLIECITLGRSTSKYPLLEPAYDISEYVSVSRISTILLMEDISMLSLPESQPD